MSTPLREVFARFSTRWNSSALRRGEAQTNSATNAVKRLGAALVTYMGFNALRNSIGGFREMGDELDKTSKVVGISIQDLQAWRHAANLSGVGAESFNTGLIRLQRNMLNAQRGSIESVEGFERLGVSFEDAEGQLRPVQDVLKDMADPLANLESSSERVGVLSVLMGRSGARIGPLFSKGAAGVEEMMAELQELGGGIGPEAVQASADLTDAQARMDLAFTSLKSKIGVVVLPVLQRAAEAFTKLAGNTSALKALLGTGLIVALVAVIAKLKAMGAAGLMSNALTLAPWLGLALAIGGVFLVLEDLYVAMEGGDSYFARQNDRLANWREEMIETGGVIGWLVEGWQTLIEQAEVLGAFLAGDIEGAKAAAGDSLERRGVITAAQNTPTMAGGQATTRTRGLVPVSQGIRAMVKGDPSTTVAPRASVERATVNQTNNVTITEAENPAQTRRILREELDRSNREMQEALVPE